MDEKSCTKFFRVRTDICSLVVLFSELVRIDATQTDTDWIEIVKSNVNMGVRLIPAGYCVLFILLSLGRRCLSFAPIQERGSGRSPYCL